MVSYYPINQEIRLVEKYYIAVEIDDQHIALADRLKYSMVDQVHV
jgi:hypothetical protein